MIESISGFLQRNLIVLLAVVLVPMKMGILRLCGDTEAQRAAFQSIPEDLVYVSMGLILGDFATSGGAFRYYFAGSPHLPMDLAVVVMFGLLVAISVVEMDDRQHPSLESSLECAFYIRSRQSAPRLSSSPASRYEHPAYSDETDCPGFNFVPYPIGNNNSLDRLDCESFGGKMRVLGV
jgi:hypothetical protein